MRQTSKLVSEKIDTLDWDTCKMMLDGIGIDTIYSFPNLEQIRLSLFHAVVAGDIHPRDILNYK